MVIAYHVVFSTYGFWLPNDPRGSGSTEVRAPHLRPFGPATFVDDRRSHAGDPHDYRKRLQAKRALWQRPVELTGRQAQAVGVGFSRFVRTSGIVIHACSIMPQHVHMVIARHRYSVEQMVNLLKGAATRELSARGLHPGMDGGLLVRPNDRVWSRNLRKIFISEIPHLIGEINYVRKNPEKEGKPRQKWSFITPLKR